jgi:isocitrate lyase
MSAAPIERVDITAAQACAPIDHIKWVRASAPIAARVRAFADAVRRA